MEFELPGRYLERYPAREALALLPSSWGTGGDYHVWENPQVEWIWPIVHRSGQAPEYARARLTEHVACFDRPLA
ncbi:MAG: hypothetical protein ABI182_06365 [Candidatus Baltobacteraceae bacterium]